MVFGKDFFVPNVLKLFLFKNKKVGLWWYERGIYWLFYVMVIYFDDDINMKIKYQFSKKNFPFFR